MEATTSKKIYIELHRDSAMAALFERLVASPSIHNREVEHILDQHLRNEDGEAQKSNPTHRSLALKLVQDMITGTCGLPHVIKKGTYHVEGVDGVVHAQIPRQVHLNIDAATTTVHVPAPQEPAEKSAENSLIFPSKPAVPKALEGFIKPEWYQRVELCLDAGKHISLAGPPGGGKSTVPEQYFISRKQPFVVVNGDAGLRRRDLEGTIELVDGTTKFSVADFAAAAINGWGAILNEANACDADALLWLNGILETPHKVVVHGQAYPVHKDFRLVVTYNVGLSGTKPMPQSFKDRFHSIKLAFVTPEFLTKLLIAKGMPADAHYGRALVLFAQNLWAMHEKGQLRYQISARRLIDAVFLIENGLSLNAALKAAVVDAIDAHADAQIVSRFIDDTF